MNDEERRLSEQEAAKKAADTKAEAEAAAKAEAEAIAKKASASDAKTRNTILWTGLAVVAILGIALFIFFFARGGSAGSGSAAGSADAESQGVLSTVSGKKDKKDKDNSDDKADADSKDGEKTGDEQKQTEETREEAVKLDDEKISQYEKIGDSNKTNVATDVTEAGTEPAKPWTTMTDADYGVRISTLAAGYDGFYIEDGSDDEVKNVLAMQFFNESNQDIQYAEYVFRSGDTAVSFKISNLPAGQSCVVLEANRHQYSKDEVLELISRVVAKVDALPFASDQVLLVDNSDNTVTIMNLTNKELPVVRLFYKYFYEDENTFLGGITYSASAEKVPAGGSVTVSPGHFESGVSIFMGSGVYEK